MPQMHQTTVRFSAELWDELQVAAANSGVSTAQFVREAALTRLAFAAGEQQARLGREAGPPFAAGRHARDVSVVVQSGSAAVTAQAQLARDRARELRSRLARKR
jgi:hypothetical protein